MHYVLTYVWMNHVDGYTCIHRYEAVAGLQSLTLPKKKKNAEILTPALNEKEEAHAESARHLAIITLQMCSEIDVSLRVALGTLNQNTQFAQTVTRTDCLETLGANNSYSMSTRQPLQLEILVTVALRVDGHHAHSLLMSK